MRLTYFSEVPEGPVFFGRVLPSKHGSKTRFPLWFRRETRDEGGVNAGSKTCAEAKHWVEVQEFGKWRRRPDKADPLQLLRGPRNFSPSIPHKSLLYN